MPQRIRDVFAWVRLFMSAQGPAATTRLVLFAHSQFMDRDGSRCRVGVRHLAEATGLRENLYGIFTVNLGVYVPEVAANHGAGCAKNWVQEYNCCIHARQGIAQIPAFVLKEAMEHGRLELLLGEWFPEPAPLNLVYPENRHASRKVRVFADWIGQLFSEHDGLQLRSTLRARASTEHP
jgi:DNA-binding transcriptional LysR family regulator